MLRYVETHAQWDGRAARLTQRARLTLFEAEAAVRDALRRSCPELGGEPLLEALCWFSWHFAARDRQKAHHDLAWYEPAEGVVYARMDFAENFNLPVGPAEAGSWWYAGSRLSLSVLVIVVWAKDVPARYITYISTVLEKTPRYVVAVWQDLLARLPSLRELLQAASTFQLWVDAGNHFRNYQVLWWQLVHLPAAYDLEGQVCVDVEHHGKGPCDGHIGRLRLWLGQAAKRQTVASADDLAKVLREAATRARESSPLAPRCGFHVFTPPPRDQVLVQQLSQTAMANAGMQVTRSYMLSGVARRLPASSMRPARVVPYIRNHIFAGEPIQRSMTGVVEAARDDPEEGDNREWRTAYRLKEPEVADPAWASMRARYRAQQGVRLPAGSRHRGLSAQATAALRSQARLRVTAAAARRRLWSRQDAAGAPAAS
jgi:hypothetical protein